MSLVKLALTHSLTHSEIEVLGIVPNKHLGMALSMMFVFALTQMFVYSASGITTYEFSQWKDSTRCATNPYQTTLCKTSSPCCRTPYGQSMRISGTCSNLQMTLFYKSKDCTGKSSHSVGNVAKLAATGCKNDALFHSRKTTCVDDDIVVANGRSLRGAN